MDNREKNDHSVNEKKVSDKSVVEKKVFSYMEKLCMLAPGDRVVLGVSGGADSVCLFLLLSEYAKGISLSLSVVHVNHGIRAEAAEDARYVEELCRERGVPFSLVEADVRGLASREGCSEEDAGRRVRYEAFGRAAKQLGGAKIAVAHNSNDNAETMLFHLFRGSGISGLSGIAPVRGNIIRPILCLERWEVEAYLKCVSVKWCQDCTNEKDDYRRNRIRHHILPYAEGEVVSGAVGHMGRTAELLRETEGYLEQQTKEAMEKCVREISHPHDTGKEAQGAWIPAFFQKERMEEGKNERFLSEGNVLGKAGSDKCAEACRKGGGLPGIGEGCAERIAQAEYGMGKGGLEKRQDESRPEGSQGSRCYQIDAAYFEKQHMVLKKRMLLYLLKQLSPTGKDISAVHVMDALALFEREGNKSVNLPFGIRAWRQYGSVFLERGENGNLTSGKNDMKSSEMAYAQDPAGRISPGNRKGTGNLPAVVSLTNEIFHTPLVYSLGDWGKIEFMGFFIKKGQEVPQKQYTKWFDYDKIKEYVEIRSRRQGDYLMIEDREGALRHKSLKDYMVTEKIPRQIRDLIPLVTEGSHVLWLPGRRISAAYKVDGNTERILRIRLLGDRFGEANETEEKNGGEH